MLELVDQLAREAGPLALVALALAAALEYVFPPFPGDTVTVFGGLFAIRGGLSPVLVFLAIMAGSLGGALLDYLFGRWVGRQLEQRREGKWIHRLPLVQLREWEQRFARRGALWLVLNRFVPALRGPVFVAAGLSRLPPLKVLIFGGISAFAWNGLLFGAGWAVGGQADRLEALLTTYGRVAWAVVGLVVLLWATHAWLHRRRVHKTQ